MVEGLSRPSDEQAVSVQPAVELATVLLQCAHCTARNALLCMQIAILNCLSCSRRTDSDSIFCMVAHNSQCKADCFLQFLLFEGSKGS